MRHPLMIAAVLGTMGAIAFAQAPAQPAARRRRRHLQAHADIKGEESPVGRRSSSVSRARARSSKSR